MKRLVLLVAAVVLAAHLSSARAADTWGDLSGRFLFDGEPPKQAPVANPSADCVAHKPVDDSLVVSKDKEVANVVIWLRTAAIKEHPDYAKTAKDKVTIDNKNCTFVPKVILLRTTQTLEIKNSDSFGHNTKADALANDSFNVIVQAGGATTKSLPKEESLPLNVGCNIHPFMGGKLLVRKSPYMAVSQADGKFEIKNLPTGKPLEFQFWHEKKGNLSAVTIKGVDGGKTDSKGRAKVTIKAGSNDLGDIKLSASLFKR